MSSVTTSRFLPLAGFAALALLGAIGCVPATTNLQTSHYSLSHPDYWKVKKQAARDGDSTIVVIPQYGSAVIDEGSGSMASKDQNYDAVTADVEVRLYNFSDPNPDTDPTQMVANFLLKADPDLKLSESFQIPDNPPECNVYPKKYMVFGKQQTPLDLVKRPGHRTIVVGGRSEGYLTAVVARVEFEPDQQRNCHNLANMRVQLQNLLDGLKATAAPAPVTPPGTPPPATPPPPPPPPAGGEATPKQ